MLDMFFQICVCARLCLELAGGVWFFSQAAMTMRDLARDTHGQK